MLFAAKCKEVPPAATSNSLPLEKFNFMTKILVWPSGAVQCLLHFWMVYDTFVMAGPTTHLVLREEDVVKLELEFLQNRDLHISQVTLERETGVINGHFSGNYSRVSNNSLDVYSLFLHFFENLDGVRYFRLLISRITSLWTLIKYCR